MNQTRTGTVKFTTCLNAMSPPRLSLLLALRAMFFLPKFDRTKHISPLAVTTHIISGNHADCASTALLSLIIDIEGLDHWLRFHLRSANWGRQDECPCVFQ